MSTIPVEPPAPVAESNIANAAKGAVRSFLFTFLALWVPAVFSFLNELMGWANEGGAAPFPAVSELGYLGIAAVVGGFSAALTFVWRLVENSAGTGFLRSSIPVQRR